MSASAASAAPSNPAPPTPEKPKIKKWVLRRGVSDKTYYIGHFQASKPLKISRRKSELQMLPADEISVHDQLQAQYARSGAKRDQLVPDTVLDAREETQFRFRDPETKQEFLGTPETTEDDSQYMLIELDTERKTFELYPTVRYKFRNELWRRGRENEARSVEDAELQAKDDARRRTAHAKKRFTEMSRRAADAAGEASAAAAAGDAGAGADDSEDELGDDLTAASLLDQFFSGAKSAKVRGTGDESVFRLDIDEERAGEVEEAADYAEAFDDDDDVGELGVGSSLGSSGKDRGGPSSALVRQMRTRNESAEQKSLRKLIKGDIDLSEPQPEADEGLEEMNESGSDESDDSADGVEIDAGRLARELLQRKSAAAAAAASAGGSSSSSSAASVHRRAPSGASKKRARPPTDSPSRDPSRPSSAPPAMRGKSPGAVAAGSAASSGSESTSGNVLGKRKAPSGTPGASPSPGAPAAADASRAERPAKRPRTGTGPPGSAASAPPAAASAKALPVVTEQAVMALLRASGPMSPKELAARIKQRYRAEKTVFVALIKKLCTLDKATKQLSLKPEFA